MTLKINILSSMPIYATSKEDLQIRIKNIEENHKGLIVEVSPDVDTVNFIENQSIEFKVNIYSEDDSNENN